MKEKLSILIFFFSFWVQGQTPVLSNANLNLNVGGYINDVVYSPYHNAYIVVGNFTTINGFARKNIAFLDKTTLTVLSTPNVFPFDNNSSAMDGEIWSVAIASNNLLPESTISLYIGGNFTTIYKSGLPITRKGIARFHCSKTISDPPNNFVLSSSWNPNLDFTPLQTGQYAEGVHDILISNDTVIFCGNFFTVDGSSGPEFREGIAAYTAGGTLLNYPQMASVGLNGARYYSMFKNGPYLYCAGATDLYTAGVYDGEILKLDATGNVISSFDYTFDAYSRNVFELEPIDDSLILVLHDLNADNSEAEHIAVIRQTNGSVKLDHRFSTSGDLGGIYPIQTVEAYNQRLYANSTSTSNSLVSFENIPFDPPVSAPIWNANATNNLTINHLGKIHIAGNKLFVSASNLTALSGQTRQRLGVYCLEPYKADFFAIYDSTVCPDDTVNFGIPAVQFADGYRWEYTGENAFLVGQGPLDSPIDLEYSGGNYVSISFYYPFTPGELKVTPYSLCNGTTKIFGTPVDISIQSNPLPHIDAGNDTSLNCYTQSSGIELYGYSDSTVVSYEWLNDFPDPSTIGQYKTALEPGNYVFRVESPLGCPNYDTVFVSMDTVPPTPVLPVPPYELTCANTQITLDGSTPNSHTILEWYIATEDTLIADPINTSAIGEHQLIATDTLNGCSKTTAIYVALNDDPPNIAIYGYPVLSSSQPIDTITCFQPSLSLQVYSDTLNSDVSWINADTTEFYGDILNISSSGQYLILATNNENGCTNSLGIFISEYLNEPHIAAPGNNVLNCSTDSLILEGFSLDVNTNKFWSSSSLPVAANPMTVYDAGVYYFTVSNPENGCQSIDSVLITTDNSITVNAGEDLYYCDKEIVSLIATYVGSISGIQYAWNDGTDLAVADYTAGIDEFAVVVVSGDGGCVGSDTVYLFTPPVPEMIFQGFKPCDDGPSGQIVVTPISGFDPFQYAINGSSIFQNSTVFSNLNIGSYVITVRDSLGCDYAYNAAIDNNSSLPEPAFMFSTYNFESDTIVIVDVSNPPTDSTIWIFPNEIVVLDDDALSPMILLPDTGTFEIIMRAFYGECLVELSKWIYASPFDSLTASLYNQNGIKSVELYPNPTTGNFTVNVEFYKEQRSALAVQDVLGTTYFFNSYEEGLVVTENITLDNTAIDGTYVVKIISEFDGASITFILAR